MSCNPHPLFLSEDNFSSNIASALIDLNNDSQKDNVYWLTNDSGLLVYNVSEGNSFADDTLSMSSNIFSEYFLNIFISL